MHLRKLVVGTIAGATAFGAMAVAGGAATTSPPKFTKTPVLTYHSSKDGKGRFITVAAFVRLDRAITDKIRRKYFLIASPGLKAGQKLPSELFGGGSLGALGKKSRHCYAADASLLKRKKSTSAGATWGIAFADSKHVVTKVYKVKIKKSSESGVINASDKLGCGA
jgi:hypothetical protein